MDFKLKLTELFNKLAEDVTIDEAIDYLLHETISNSIEVKCMNKEIVHPISKSIINHLNVFKSLQDREIATDYVIERYEKDLALLSKTDFNKIVDLIGADEEQALENCVQSMRELLEILKVIKK